MKRGVIGGRTPSIGRNARRVDWVDSVRAASDLASITVRAVMMDRYLRRDLNTLTKFIEVYWWHQRLSAAIG